MKLHALIKLKLLQMKIKSLSKQALLHARLKEIKESSSDKKEK